MSVQTNIASSNFVLEGVRLGLDKECAQMGHTGGISHLGTRLRVRE